MMIDYFEYTKTPAGKLVYKNSAQQSADLLGVSSTVPGEFEVKAKGNRPEVGEFVFLPLKGATQMSLRLEVESIEPLINPIGAWNARCKGPSQAQFDIKKADITCDDCGQVSSLEFVDFGKETQHDAIVGMNKAGWQATKARQICPKCKK